MVRPGSLWTPVLLLWFCALSLVASPDLAAEPQTCTGSVVLPLTGSDRLSPHLTAWTEKLLLAWSGRTGLALPTRQEVERLQAQAQMAFMDHPEAWDHFGEHFGFDTVVTATATLQDDGTVAIALVLRRPCLEAPAWRAELRASGPDQVAAALGELIDGVPEGLAPTKGPLVTPPPPTGEPDVPVKDVPPEPWGLLVSAWVGGAFPITTFPIELRHFVRVRENTRSLFGEQQQALLASVAGGVRVSYSMAGGWLDVGLDATFGSLLLEEYVRQGRLGTWISLAPYLTLHWRPFPSVPVSVEVELAVGLGMLLPGEDSRCHGADLERTVYAGDLVSRCEGNTRAYNVYDLMVRPALGLRWMAWRGLELRFDLVGLDILTGLGPGDDLASALYGFQRDPDRLPPDIQLLHSTAPLGVQIFYTPRLHMGWRF